ncbi:MAG: hypothetical protein JWP44_3476 [Mucilaginibacter sp.]|nr:hypothetical protein [Mucilaginibacter sp.]
MKTITLTFAIILGWTCIAQAADPVIITFKKDAQNHIIVDNPQASYPLPLRLHLSQVLLTGKRKLAIFVKGAMLPIVPAYTISNLHPANGFYDFNIDNTLKINPCDDGEGRCTITDPAFTIKIDGVSAGTITTSNAPIQFPVPPPAPIALNNPDHGYPFYDAVFLGNLDYQTSGPLYKTIFQYYNITKQADVEANPFFKNKFPNLYVGPGAGGTSVTALLQSAGNADVTNIADGLAKFIVARMKEELSVAFFSKFKAELDKPEGQKLKIIFPTTYAALTQIDKEIYNYPQYLQALRGAFQKDLTLMLPNLQKLINDKDFLSGYPEVKTVLSDAAYIAQQFKNGSHPGAILNDYLSSQAKQASLNNIDNHIYPSLQTLNLISQSLRSKYGQNYWVSADSLNMLFTNELTSRLYFGFLYQQLLTVKDGDITFPEKSVKTFLTEQAVNIDLLETSYRPYLTNLFNQVKTVDAYFAAVKKASKAGNQQPDYADYYGLVSATADLIKLMEQCPALVGAPAMDAADAKINRYLDAIKALSGIYVDLYYKQYPTAIIDINTLFQNTLITQTNTNYNAKSDELKTVQQQASPAAAAVDDLKAQVKKLDDERKKKQSALDALTKYGNFVATVAAAQNSDDVQKAIEAIAMPAGSAGVKRNAIFNIAINAYIGPYLGGEKTHDFDKSAATSYGLTVPVGVSFSVGNTPFKGWSVSAFVSLIDIGAIASYRIGNGTTLKGTDTLKSGTIPEVKLKNIVSPGLFLSVGLPKVPISIQGGYQLAPTLRSITVVNSQNQVLDPNANGLANQYASKLYSRWSMSIVVDIPIINVFTKGK